uniref:Uncharacterized protein n=1 Tax=Arundo donax TaxID=35708 RepID=A0A0A9E530_ARUDO
MECKSRPLHPEMHTSIDGSLLIVFLDWICRSHQCTTIFLYMTTHHASFRSISAIKFQYLNFDVGVTVFEIGCSHYMLAV